MLNKQVVISWSNLSNILFTSMENNPFSYEKVLKLFINSVNEEFQRFQFVEDVRMFTAMCIRSLIHIEALVTDDDFFIHCVATVQDMCFRHIQTTDFIPYLVDKTKPSDDCTPFKYNVQGIVDGMRNDMFIINDTYKLKLIVADYTRHIVHIGYTAETLDELLLCICFTMDVGYQRIQYIQRQNVA